jgi:two-component system OmpR family response regulator
VVLVLDDNQSLLDWLGALLAEESIAVMQATTAAQARELVAARRPDAALLDMFLPDGDGLALALEFRSSAPRMQSVLMTGMELSADETSSCEQSGIPVLRKPFLGQEAINAVRSRLAHAPAVRASGK